MYQVYIETYFSSAHRLVYYKGKCENLHGHNWRVGVLVEKEELDKSGIVLDFNLLKKITKSVLNQLDHKYLNDIPFFKTCQPKAENIAKYIYDKILNKLKKYGIKKLKIFVWETPFQYASYEK